MSLTATGGEPHWPITSYMSQDGTRLRALLAEVDRLLEDEQIERADHLFQDFYAGLLRHMQVEEDLLFPLFEQRAGVLGSPIERLRGEHRELSDGLAKMHDALAHLDARRYARARLELGALLASHEAKEGRVFYPVIDRCLRADEAATLRARIERP